VRHVIICGEEQRGLSFGKLWQKKNYLYFRFKYFQLNRIFLLLFGLVTIVAHAQVPDYVPTEGLVDWWPLDGNATNLVGVNDGEIEGCLPTENRFGEASKALFFDGQNDRVSLDTFFGGQQMAAVSYSLWFNSNGSPDVQFLSGKEGFWRTIYIRLDPANDIRFGGTSQGVYFGVSSDEQAFSLGTWYHLVVTFEDAVITLFLDGNQIAQGSSAANLLEYQFYAAGNSTATNYFGATHPVSPGLSWFFSGKMDDFGLWNRALTECEIAALYAAESNTTVSVSAGADLSICSGDSIVLSASGGNSTYTWSNGIEDGVAFVPDSSSYFTVEGSLGACTSTDTVFVEVLQPTAGMDTQVVCDSLTWLDGITYTASTNEPSFALTNAAGCDSLVTLDLTVNYTTYNTIDTTVVNVLEYNGEEYTEGGEYLVYLENEAGCDSIVTIKLTLEYVGVDDLETPDAWSVYPNPIESQLTISSANALEFHLVQIFNALGQVIWSERVSAQVTIEVDAWPRGMYVVDIQGEAVEARERMQIVLK